MLIIHLSSFCIQIPNKLNCNTVVNLPTEVNFKKVLIEKNKSCYKQRFICLVRIVTCPKAERTWEYGKFSNTSVKNSNANFTSITVLQHYCRAQWSTLSQVWRRKDIKKAFRLLFQRGNADGQQADEEMLNILTIKER